MDTKDEGKREVRLSPGLMQEAEYVRQDMIVTAERGHTIADVMKPAYWFHVARDLKPYAHIEVRGYEGEWIAFLMVLNAGINWAQCILLSQHDLQASAAEEPEDAQLFQVKWRSPQSKYAVIRIADNKVLQDGFPKKADAYAWGEANDTIMRV